MSENCWRKINVVFRLKSPLHIGYMPFKGSVVSPTRYYVLGRNLWGAVTKRITEFLHKNPSAKNYWEIGKKVIENLRFSYFYLYDGKTVYMPHYTEEGLKFGKMTKAEFEHRFIGSIVSTAIDSKSRTAKDESLHEIEFINNKFKDGNGNIKAVKIAGCIWVKENARIKDKRIKDKKIIINDNGIFIDNCKIIISELILGGESKYGFGHVLLDSINKIEFPNFAAFEYDDSKDKEIITIKIKPDEPIPAHLKYTKDIKFKGDVELLTGRGYYDPKELKTKKDNSKNNTCSEEQNGSNDGGPGKIISKSEYYLSPGTVLKENINCTLNWMGALNKD